jgi:PAS domain S-box-containing protein
MDYRKREPALWVLLAGLFLSALAAVYVRHDNMEDLAAESRAQAEKLVVRVVAVMERATLGLRGTRGYFLGAGIDEVTQAGFRAYYESRDLAREFPGVMGIGFIRRVALAEEDTFVARARRQGAADFAIRALQPHDGERRVIQFVEPVATNRAAIGLDVASEANRLHASDLALASAEPILTGPIRLVQAKQGSSLGLLMFLRMPLASGPAGLGVDSGPGGYVYAPIQLDELLQSTDLGADLVTVGIVDVTDAGKPVDFQLGSAAAAAVGVAPVVLDQTIMSRDWRFTVTPLPALATSLHPLSPAAVGGTGVLASVLLALLVGVSGRLRQHTQDGLSERTRLATMLDHASDGIIGLDLQGRVILWNKAATDLFGFTADEAMGKPLTGLTLTPEHMAEDAHLLREALAGRATPPFETQRSRRGGEPVDVEVSAGPMFDADGSVVGAAKVLRPISARLELARTRQSYAEDLERQVVIRSRQHAEAEQDLRNVLDAMPSLVGSWDRNLRNRFANKVYADFFDRDPERLPGCSIEDLLGPELFARNRPYIDAALRGEEQRFERDLPRRDGAGVRHTLTHYLPQRQGDEVVGFYVLVHDVTDIKQTQTRLANILEGTQAGTWEWNVATGEMALNERWAEMVGYTLEELQPASIDTWRRLSHADDLAHAGELLQQHFDGLAPAYECEVRVRHKHGHWVWVLDRGKVVSRGADGQPLWMAGTHQDISERKQAELALRHGEALLARTGAMAHVGGWELDIATGTVWWSDETCRIHGLPAGHRPTVDDAITYYAPEVRPMIQQLVECGMREGRGWDVELPMVRADGMSIWVRALGEVQFDGATPVRLVGALQDITAQRSATEALRVQERMMQSMLEAAPVAVRVASRRDNRVRFVNQQFANLVRRKAEQSLGLDIASCYVNPEAYADVRHRLAQGEFIIDSLVELHLPDQPDVPHVWALASYMNIDHLGEPSVLAWLYDVTDLRQARENARAAEELMQQALEATQTALAIYDKNDCLEVCTPRYHEMHARIADKLQPGVPFEEIARTSVERDVIALPVTDQQAWVRERVARHREGGEFIRHTRDGRYIRVVERLLHTGKLVSIRLDVTEMVQAREAAEAASRAKSDFVASTSHEIRTPLNAILGLAYLMERSELPAQAQLQARQIAQAGQSLLALVNDVLDISKIEAGQLEIESMDFDLRALVANEVALLGGALKDRHVVLQAHVDDDVPALVRGDITRMRQVLVNLLSNALKFTEQGSVNVHLGRGARLPWIELEVSDTGIGIAPDVKARLFKPFEQADTSTTRRFGGTGLGLAITGRLVTLMGGEIALDSLPGVGSTFTVTLPLPEVEGAGRQAAFGEARPLRVLLADDDETQLSWLVELARLLGWQCCAVSSGRALLTEAMAAANKGQPFDAMVVDWQMPDLDGLCALALLRDSLPQNVWPAAVVVSQQEIGALGAAPHSELASSLLVKPVDGSMLFNAVNQSVAAMPECAARLLETSLVGQVDAYWLAGVHLLVVDDSTINLDVARKVLELEGARVSTCSSGRQALEVLASSGEAFDAVLLDVQMPEMDGLEVLRRVRLKPELGELPVIALTAGVQRQERDAALAAGMTDFLAKPLEPQRLIRCLRRHIEGWRGFPIPLQPRDVSARCGPVAELLGIEGIDDDAIAPSLRRDRPLLLSMIRRVLVEYADIGTLAPEALPAALHKLRGSAGVIGATRLAATASRLETAISSAKGGARPEQLTATLMQQLEAIRGSAQAALAMEAERLERSLPEERQVDVAPLTQQELDELLALINEQNVRAAVLVEKRARQLTVSIGADQLARLRAALQEFDFAGAIAAIGLPARE